MQDNAKETFEFDPKKLLKVEIDKVRENSWNPKSRDTKEYEDVKRSIEINGLTQPIFVRENNNGESEYEVLDGAHRLRACKELGYKEIYIYNEGDVADELAKSFTIFHQVQVPFDKKLLKPLVLELNEVSIELPDTGIQLELSDNGVIEDDEFVAEIDETEAPKSKLGEVYQLGRHRLICGDATNPSDIEKLMDGEKADIAFTSPPYNAGCTATEVSMGKTSKYKHDSDNKSVEDYRSFLDSYLNLALNYSQYVFMNIQMLSNNKKALIGTLFDNLDYVADCIIWDKLHAQPAMARKVLNSRFEYVWVFSQSATRAIGVKDFRGTIDNVLELSRQSSNDFAKIHNASFSLDFASWFISNFSLESVLEQFAGTGTTLIACEQLGRKCYAMELDPTYCDVIRKRYWAFTHDGDETGWEEGTSRINDSESVA